MIKLLIEIDNIWSILDLGDDKPAMNYQANNIAELKNRQADYSQALKLPLTKNNCALFGRSDSFDVITDFPYQKHNCRLFSNDSVLAGPGSFLILDRLTDFFEVQILSGNADLFTTLSLNKMSELNLGSSDIGVNSILQAINTPLYCIPVATFLKGGATSLNTTPEHAYPFMYLKPAIESLITQNGYTIQTNLLDSNWNRKAINIVSLTPSPGSNDIFRAIGFGNKLAGTTDSYVPFSINVDYSGALSIDAKYLKYTIPVDCSMRIVYSAHINSGSIFLETSISNLTLEGESKILFNQNSISDNICDITANFLKGDIIFVSTLIHATSTTGQTANCSFDFKEMVSTVIPLKGSVFFAPNIGFDTQLDFFKMFVQLFGLTVSVDNETKIVRAFTMQKLYDNKPIAKDWSKKLHDVKENEMNFITPNSYGQNNFIRFDDNTLDLISDSGSFQIQNDTLPISKDLFGIKFESGVDKIFGDTSIPVANIPIEEIDTDLVISFKGGKPHIVDISDGLYTEFTPPSTIVSSSVKIATHAKVQSFVDSFYPGLITMLSDAKYKIDQFYLTDQDIEDFDPFVPVYISKYGAYFYVNKINNYISKTLTKVELIKL